MTKTISATAARANFAEVIDRVLYSGDEYIIQKQGKPAAVIAPIKITQTKKQKNKIAIKPNQDFESLYGSLSHLAIKGKSIDEIIKMEEDAVGDAVAEDYRRKFLKR